MMGSETKNWQTPEQMYELLNQLVGFDSRTGTPGELEFPHFVKEKLEALPYFQKNESHLHLIDAGMAEMLWSHTIRRMSLKTPSC